MFIRAIIFQSLVTVALLLQGCSNDGFHLREPQTLSKQFQKIQLKKISSENDFSNAFELALEESGGQLVEKAKTRIIINNFREGRRVVAYDKDRKPRVYLLFLKFEYQIEIENIKLNDARYRINLDRTFVYDANYALGKAEEENKILHELYAEASRLILLKLASLRNN